jgi:hypothetical protein
VRDSANRTVWSSGSACASPSNATQKCYSYLVANNGQLVVQDQARNVVWGSPADAAVASTPATRTTQLVSNSAPELSCIWSGPGQAPAVLVSRDGRYMAMVDEVATLQVVDLVSSTTTFSPAGAKPGAATGMLCLRNRGELILLGRGGRQALLAPAGHWRGRRARRLRSASTLLLLLLGGSAGPRLGPLSVLPLPSPFTPQAPRCSGSPATASQQTAPGPSQCASQTRASCRCWTASAPCCGRPPRRRASHRAPPTCPRRCAPRHPQP